MKSTWYHSCISQVAQDPLLGSTTAPSAEQPALAFIQTEIGTPIPPELGLGTTSAVPDGGKRVFRGQRHRRRPAAGRRAEIGDLFADQGLGRACAAVAVRLAARQQRDHEVLAAGDVRIRAATLDGDLGGLIDFENAKQGLHVDLLRRARQDGVRIHRNRGRSVEGVEVKVLAQPRHGFAEAGVRALVGLQVHALRAGPVGTLYPALFRRIRKPAVRVVGQQILDVGRGRRTSSCPGKTPWRGADRIQPRETPASGAFRWTKRVARRRRRGWRKTSSTSAR